MKIQFHLDYDCGRAVLMAEVNTKKITPARRIRHSSIEDAAEELAKDFFITSIVKALSFGIKPKENEIVGAITVKHFSALVIDADEIDVFAHYREVKESSNQNQLPC